jgi:hypothetical protein
MPIGTLVRIQKINSIQGTLDVSKEGLVGYITGKYTYSDNVTSYQVHIFNSSNVVSIFPNGNKLNFYEHYLSPVTETE